MSGLLKSWALKKDGQQIKKIYTGNYSNGEPVVKVSGTITYIAITSRADIAPLTLLNLLEEARAPKVGGVYTEGSANIERTFYTDATPRFVGPRGNYWEWEVAYSVGGVYLDAPQAPSTSEAQEKTLFQFSTSIELEDYATACDLDGLWNVNSLGDFFSDPLIFKYGILNLQYQFREYANPLALSRDFFQAINDASWYGFDRDTVKCSDISFNATSTTSGTYYDTTYKLQYRPRGWKIDKADSGFYYAAGGVVHRALNADGSPTSDPVLLNGQGGLLASGSPVFRYFRMNPEKNFDALDLPDPFNL